MISEYVKAALFLLGLLFCKQSIPNPSHQASQDPGSFIGWTARTASDLATSLWNVTQNLKNAADVVTTSKESSSHKRTPNSSLQQSNETFLAHATGTLGASLASGPAQLKYVLVAHRSPSPAPAFLNRPPSSMSCLTSRQGVAWTVLGLMSAHHHTQGRGLHLCQRPQQTSPQISFCLGPYLPWLMKVKVICWFAERGKIIKGELLTGIPVSRCWEQTSNELCSRRGLTALRKFPGGTACWCSNATYRKWYVHPRGILGDNWKLCVLLSKLPLFQDKVSP